MSLFQCKDDIGMNCKRDCMCCGQGKSSTERTEYVHEEEETRYEVVAAKWRVKMVKSGFFSSSEIDVILPVWIEFIRKILQANSDTSADEFYMHTATICAQQLKHYSENGWQCLLGGYAPTILKCFENSLEEQETKEPSVSSEESSCDIHAQVEFLLQLVASSNVCLYLVRQALNKSFAPSLNNAKSTSKLYTPRNYLESNLKSLQREQIRKNLIHGTYDGYILPLQIANEVNDEFWETECAEICSVSTISKSNA